MKETDREKTPKTGGEYEEAIKTGETLKKIMELFDSLDYEYKNVVITELKTRLRESEKPAADEETETATGLWGLLGANKRVGSTYRSLGNILKKK